MAATLDTSREPCPDRILDDAGSAFGMGAVGGSIFYFAKGLYNSPNGHRLAGGGTAVRMNAPRVGGRFAIWGCLFSTFDCAMVYARGREDPWNSIAAGAAAGGLLSLRRGLLATATSAVGGGAFLALIEGAGIAIQRLWVDSPAGQDQGQYAPPPGVVVEEVPVAAPGPMGWLAGLFGRKQQDNRVAGGDLKSEVLLMDLPSDAIPSFD
jgi:import inner membrane translocase subunit TIM17